MAILALSTSLASVAQVGLADPAIDPDVASERPGADAASRPGVPPAALAAWREGERLLRVTGLARDPVQACLRFDEAARLAAGRLPQADYRLGLCHVYGWGRPADAGEALAWFRRAATQGLPAAQTRLGVALWRGQGVDPDRVQAESWLRRAATAGDPSAMLALGLMMQAGDVPGATARDGIDWLRRAAEMGDSSAALALAQAYRAGRGLVADPGSAGRWLQRAADARNPSAQIVLAQWYLEGRLLERSALHAYAWSRIAIGQLQRLPDRSNAERLLQRATAVGRQAAGELNASQLLEAQSLARDWTPGSLALHPVRESTAGMPRADESVPRPEPGAQTLPPVRTQPPGADPTAPRSAARPRLRAGSGFFVSREGHLVTNDHVVRDCRVLRLPDGQTVEVVGRDSRADLALLRAQPVSRFARLRADNRIEQGEDVLTYGFPLHGVLSSSGQLGAGMVTALTGLRDNPLQLQIDVPVQSGNSGGPLLDLRGQVVGVVVSKLNAFRVAQITGDIPQNVNFAVRLEPLKALLVRHGVTLESLPVRSPEKSRQALAEEARGFSTAVLCEPH
jgi:TPR repeat protein